MMNVVLNKPIYSVLGNPQSINVLFCSNMRIIFRKKDLMQVTLEETHVTLLSSTKWKFKGESTEEDSIAPRLEGL